MPIMSQPAPPPDPKCTCGYNLAGLAGNTRCPECGQLVGEAELRRTSRSRRAARAARVIAAVYALAIIIIPQLGGRRDYLGPASGQALIVYLAFLCSAPFAWAAVVLLSTLHRAWLDRLIFALVAAVAAIPSHFLLSCIAWLLGQLVLGA